MNSYSEPTLYDSIGVKPDASEETILRSVKRMTKSIRSSDERNSKKNELLRFVKKARDTLLDPDTRESYDRSIGIETLKREDRLVGYNEKRSVNRDPISELLGSIVPMTPASTFGGIDDIFSSHMNMIQSIIPNELNMEPGKMGSGTFHFTEYTRVRNSSGGYDEFGLTREGDTQNDRVTEKRFRKKS